MGKKGRPLFEKTNAYQIEPKSKIKLEHSKYSGVLKIH